MKLWVTFYGHHTAMNTHCCDYKNNNKSIESTLKVNNVSQFYPNKTRLYSKYILNIEYFSRIQNGAVRTQMSFFLSNEYKPNS